MYHSWSLHTSGQAGAREDNITTPLNSTQSLFMWVVKQDRSCRTAELAVFELFQLETDKHIINLTVSQIYPSEVGRDQKWSSKSEY